MKKKIKLIIFHPYSYLGVADNSLTRLVYNLNLTLYITESKVTSQCIITENL